MQASVTGILASRNKEYEYFTSTLYPLLVEDALSISEAAQGAILWGLQNEQMTIGATPVSASLQATIVYQTYNEPLAAEALNIGATPVSADLQATIVYKTYNEPLATEALNIGATPISADMQVTINYVNYNNGEIEQISIGATPLSGTLE